MATDARTATRLAQLPSGWVFALPATVAALFAANPTSLTTAFAFIALSGLATYVAHQAAHGEVDDMPRLGAAVAGLSIIQAA